MPLPSRFARPLLRRPDSAPGQRPRRFRSARMFRPLGKTLTLGLWLRVLGYAALGLVLEDFQASGLIWLLLLASAFFHQHPWLVQRHGAIARWSWSIPLALLPIGMALPSWALFLTALPMGLLFASMILTAHQPLRACIAQSLAAYGLSNLVISAVVLVLDMAGGDRFSTVEGLTLGLVAIGLLRLGSGQVWQQTGVSPADDQPVPLPSDLYRWWPGWLAVGSLLLGLGLGLGSGALPQLALLLGR